jgi:hypothetical protein
MFGKRKQLTTAHEVVVSYTKQALNRNLSKTEEPNLHPNL